jgi:hypothetical protein
MCADWYQDWGAAEISTFGTASVRREKRREMFFD